MEVRDRDQARRLLDIPEGRRVALFLGLIRPYKGVDLLLEAYSRVPDRERWFLVVAGEPWGGLGDRLQRMVRGLGLEDLVRLDLRWIPEPEVPTFLAAADVLVLPYRSGSQSAVAPIALASGVPVFASAVGGLPEVVDDGVNGVLVEPGSVEALVRALNGLDDERLAELTAGARAWRGTVTWDSYAAALEDLLARVVEASR
jgi:glycosyltransferase involved in cell wall biosynthesis